MAVHPLRPATDRRLGGPLPLQPANQTQTPPTAVACSRGHPFFLLPCAKRSVFGISSRFQLLSPSAGQVVYALLTRLPLDHKKSKLLSLSFDLHVLRTPPAFVLSQDQTLRDSFIRAFRLVFSFVLSFFLKSYLHKTSHSGVWFVVLFSFQRSSAAWRLVYLTKALLLCQD